MRNCEMGVLKFVFGFWTFVTCLEGLKDFNVDHLFDEFIKKYNKTYIAGSEEYSERLEVFKVTWAIIPVVTM